MKTKHKYFLSVGLFLLFLFSIAFYIYQQKQDFDRHQKPEIAGQLPNIQYYDQDDNSYALYDNTAKLKLISFWASWCAPCLVELPMFQKLYADYHKQGLEILAINLDDTKKEAQRGIKKIWPKHNIEFTTFYDFTKNSARTLNLAGLPTNYLVNKNNEIILESRGLQDWTSKEIRKLIEENLN